MQQYIRIVKDLPDRYLKKGTMLYRGYMLDTQFGGSVYNDGDLIVYIRSDEYELVGV